MLLKLQLQKKRIKAPETRTFYECRNNKKESNKNKRARTSHVALAGKRQKHKNTAPKIHTGASRAARARFMSGRKSSR
jgi:hypothetical protein